MGQYYNIVVKEQKEKKFKVYDRTVDGEYGMAKLMEHSWIGNEIMGYAAGLLYHRPSILVWCGDYSEKEELKPIGIDYKEVWGDENNSPKTLPFAKNFDKYIEEEDYPKYCLINHDKKCYLSFKKYLEQFKKGEDYIVHPLSLLTAIGNGRGGGDYSGSNEADVGFWAGDLLEINEKAPTGYKEYKTKFEEGGLDNSGKMTMYVGKEGKETKRVTIEMFANAYFKNDIKKANGIWEKLKNKLPKEGKKIQGTKAQYCYIYDEKNKILIIFGKNLNNIIAAKVSDSYFLTKKDEPMIKTIETICVAMEKNIKKKVNTKYADEGVDKKVTISWKEDEKVNRTNNIEVILSPQTRNNKKDILQNIIDAFKTVIKARDLDKEIKQWIMDEEKNETKKTTSIETKVKILKAEMFSIMSIVKMLSKVKK